MNKINTILSSTSIHECSFSGVLKLYFCSCLGTHNACLHRAGVAVEPGWPCNGPLLRLAEDVARRLLAAFDTATGMPYGTVNLRYGVPLGETSITCTAGVGTFILEFGTLSRLTGDPLFEEVKDKMELGGTLSLLLMIETGIVCLIRLA
jgi:hypothetical protein